ncbi:MAG: sugar phosphate nucleotidyltransferase [Cetobacterium sp.]
MLSTFEKLLVNFIENDKDVLIFVNNIFYDNGFAAIVKEITKRKIRTIIFGYHINNLKTFGVLEFDNDEKIISYRRLRYS